MITVRCGSCSASFKAKDELAGRRGKCPSCGAEIQVPAASAGAAPAAPRPTQPSAARAAAPGAPAGARTGAVVKSGAARASRAPGAVGAGGGRHPARRGGKGKQPMGKGARIGLITVVVVVVAGVIAYFASRPGEPTGTFALGLDHIRAGRLSDAQAAFEAVLSTDEMYEEAQVRLADVRQQLAAQEAQRELRHASEAFEVIKSVQKSYVDRDGKGYMDPDYVPNTRYVLKRCKEYLERWPTAANVAEVKQIQARYANVTSLDTPPTEADVRAEWKFRLLGKNPNMRKVMEAIDDFATRVPDKADVAAELRAELQAFNVQQWGMVLEDLRKRGKLEPGAEEWQDVAAEILQYHELLEGVPGLTPPPASVELLKRAQAGG